MALDALRGFDMFWILGVDSLVAALGRLSDRGWMRGLVRQLDHSEWAGFTFYDLIFPLFVFIVGVSVVLSLGKAPGAPGRWRRVLVRGALLFLLGLVYSEGVRRGWANVRLLGVLQRIALCYTVAALLFLWLRPAALAAICAALLLGYWALLALVPVRDISLETRALAAREAATGLPARELFARTNSWVRGGTAQGRNLPEHVDFLYLPGRKYDGAYDPEGLLSTLPAIATCLLGVFAGLLLRRRDLSLERKVHLLLAAGILSLALGWLWSMAFPVVKQLWTSSYVLVAGGWSAVLLGAFVQVIDGWGWRRCALPFVWIGMNPIVLYMGHKLVDFDAIAERLVGGPVAGALGAWGPVLVVTVSLALIFVVARFLYRRAIFLRL